MRRIFFIFILILPAFLFGQDQLYTRDGRVLVGEVISISLDHVLFKPKDSIGTREIPKESLVLVQKAGGVRHVFGKTRQVAKPVTKPKERAEHLLGFQPLDLFAGRGTLVYEALMNNGTIGLAIPISITFNPYKHSVFDTAAAAKVKGVSLIAGIDLNFYLGQEESFRFFIGPRLRYGTDILMGGFQAFTAQTQLGWRLQSDNRALIQHLAVGLGFAQVYAIDHIPNPDVNQFFGWYSVTYRMSFRL